MSEQRMNILEDQVDVIAQQVEALRLQMQGLLDVLGNKKNSQLLGVTGWEITDLRQPARAILKRGSHKDEREARVRKAEHDAEIEALLSDVKRRKAYKELTGKDYPSD